MGIISFLFGSKKGKNADETEPIEIKISSSIVYKEMALYTAISLIANAISQCEFKSYKKNMACKDEDWYLLNVEPNKNENASLFWNKVITTVIREKEALVIEHNNELHLAAGYSIVYDCLNGNRYENVSLSDGTTMVKTYSAEDVYLFSMEERSAVHFINGLFDEYNGIIESAVRAFKDTNGRKYKLVLDDIKVGDEEFAKDWEQYISKQITTYMKNEYATYVQYEGYELEREENNQAKSADDIVKIKEDMFETVGQALKIPSSLMLGNVTSVKEVCNVFLTFGVDPWADMISRTLNMRAGKKAVLDGDFYRVNTGKVKHRDVVEDAPNLEKLIGSGFTNIDETREEMDYEPTGTEFGKQHWLTKNWAKIEDVANGTAEGGEKNAEE